MNFVLSSRSALCVLALGASLGASQSALAAAATATAQITNLTSTGLVLSNDQFLSDAMTALDARSNPYHSGFNTGSTLNPYFFNDTSAGRTAYAEISDQYAPLPETHAGAIKQGFGEATVLWTFDWTASATGQASIDLEYLYSATIMNFQAGERAIASSLVSAFVDGTGISQESFKFFNNRNGDTSGIEDLVLNFAVVAGQKGTITVTTASNALVAPVPVPAAVWLLVSGVASLFGWSRRRA